MRACTHASLCDVSFAPTDKRKVVKVLLRLDAASGGRQEGARVLLAGYEVIVLGLAKPKDWPQVETQPTDLEGMCWTMERQVPTVVNNLRALPEVIAAKGQDGLVAFQR